MKRVILKTIMTRLFVILLLLILSGTYATSLAAAGKIGTAVYIDMAGRQVTLRTEIKRIALFRPRDIYMLTAILGKDLQGKLVTLGTDLKIDDIDTYNKISSVYTGLDNLAKVGSIYDDSINVEKMLLLDLDLIIIDKVFYESYAHTAIDKMLTMGMPVFFIDLETDPFHSVQKTMTMLGKILGKVEHTSKITAYMDQKSNNILDRVARLLTTGITRPKLYFELGNLPPSEIGGTRGDTSSGWGYTWKRLGAENIGVGNGMNPMNPEQVLVSNPDVIIIGGANWDTQGIMKLGFYAKEETGREHLGLYAKRKGWSDLAAIKKGRLYAIHFHYHAYPYFFAGIEATAKALYPEQFKDLDPERDMAEFFKKFMPFPYTGVHSIRWKK